MFWNIILLEGLHECLIGDAAYNQGFSQGGASLWLRTKRASLLVLENKVTGN